MTIQLRVKKKRVKRRTSKGGYFDHPLSNRPWLLLFFGEEIGGSG